jgi:hypothetical protein
MLVAFKYEKNRRAPQIISPQAVGDRGLAEQILRQTRISRLIMKK